jgi:hypothetical protein
MEANNNKWFGSGAAKSKLRTMVVASAIAASTIFVPALRGQDPASGNPDKVANAEKASVYFDGNMGLSYEQPIIKEVANIPLYIRNVPVNPDDEQFAGSDAPIQQNYLNPSSRAGIFTAKLGVRAGTRHLSFKEGVGLDFLFDTDLLHEQNNRPNTAERGYEDYAGTNTRGVGTALTYTYAGERYWGGNWNNSFRPFAFGEFGVNLSKVVSLNLNCKAYDDILYLSNGWDRYDALQTRAKYSAADYLIVAPSLTLRYIFETDDADKLKSYIEMSVGTSRIGDKSYTALGSQLSITERSFPLLFSFKIGFMR